MSVKILTEHHSEILSLKVGYSCLYLSKYHIVGNHVSRLNYYQKYLIPIDVPRPLINDLWVFLFQKIDAECVK